MGEWKWNEDLLTREKEPNTMTSCTVESGSTDPKLKVSWCLAIPSPETVGLEGASYTVERRTAPWSEIRTTSREFSSKDGPRLLKKVCRLWRLHSMVECNNTVKRREPAVWSIAIHTIRYATNGSLFGFYVSLQAKKNHQIKNQWRNRRQNAGKVMHQCGKKSLLTMPLVE